MTKVTRISISVEEHLLETFDTLMAEQGVPTRSEAIKNLMRAAIVEREWADGELIAGAVTLVYDHHKPGVIQKLTDVQHEFGDLVLCSQHAHLDHHNCMEIIIVRGSSESIRKLYSGIVAIKGLKHTALTMATTGTRM